MWQQEAKGKGTSSPAFHLPPQNGNGRGSGDMQHRWDKYSYCWGAPNKDAWQRSFRDPRSQKMERGMASTRKHWVRMEKIVLETSEKEASQWRNMGWDAKILRSLADVGRPEFLPKTSSTDWNAVAICQLHSAEVSFFPGHRLGCAISLPMVSPERSLVGFWPGAKFLNIYIL